MKKFISILLVALLAVGILASCGGDTSGVKNGGIKSTALADSSENQQRWLRLPDGSTEECNLVINPAEYSGSASGNFNRLPLNVGFLDENDNVKYTLNDAIFILESNAANGKEGEQVLFPNYDQDAEDVNMRYTVKNMDVFVDGTKVTATPVVAAGKEPDPTSSQNISMREKIDVNYNIDYVAVINVISCEGQWKLQGSTSKPGYTLLAESETNKTGLYAYNLSEIFDQQVTAEDLEKYGTDQTTLNLTLSVYGTGSTLVFDDYKILAVERGFKYAASDASTTWYPYGIVSKLEYPNGTAAEVMDYFAGYNTIARRITFTQNGSFFLAGKVDGKLTYDSKKTIMMVEGNGFNYAIAPKKKQYIMFYDSEADMLARKNGTEEPTANTQYWTVSCGRLEIGSDLYVAIALDDKLSTEALAEAANEATKAGKTAKRIESNIEYWDKYLEAITIPSDLIINPAPSAN